MFENVFRDVGNTTRVAQRLFALDVPDLTVFHLFFLFHRAYVIHTERQHIVVADGVDDGIGMQFFTKGIFGGLDDTGASGHILDEDGRTCESKEIVFLETLDDELVHIAELRAVALVEDHHDFLMVDVAIRVLLDVARQFLYRRDDNLALRVGNLLFQNPCGCVAVGGSFLETVVLAHGLIVQILAVDNEQHFVDIWKARGKLGGLERGERLAATRGMPDVAASLPCTVEPRIMRHLDAVQQAFCGRYLIGAHGHQYLLLGKYTETGEDAQQ